MATALVVKFMLVCRQQSLLTNVTASVWPVREGRSLSRGASSGYCVTGTGVADACSVNNRVREEACRMARATRFYIQVRLRLGRASMTTLDVQLTTYWCWELISEMCQTCAG
jgi:hypothetical protein